MGNESAWLKMGVMSRLRKSGLIGRGGGVEVLLFGGLLERGLGLVRGRTWAGDGSRLDKNAWVVIMIEIINTTARVSVDLMWNMVRLLFGGM